MRVCKKCGVERPVTEYPFFPNSQYRRRICKTCWRLGKQEDESWYLTIPFKDLIMYNRRYTEKQNEERFEYALSIAGKWMGLEHVTELTQGATT